MRGFTVLIIHYFLSKYDVTMPFLNLPHFSTMNAEIIAYRMTTQNLQGVHKSG